MKRLGTLLVLPDAHCGSLLGLTPPQFELAPADHESAEYALYEMRRGLYSWWYDEIKALKKIDGVLAMGDLIEGSGLRNGGADNLTSDRVAQTLMAANLLKTIGAENVFMVRGTPYHVGDTEQWEDLVAKFVESDIQDRVFLEVFGHIVYARHKIGKSGAPTGWASAPARELTWNLINESTQNHPNAELMFFAHIHEFTAVSKWGKTAITCPALQLPGTSYGGKMMSGNYDVGFLHIDFYEGGKYDVVPHLYPNQQYAPKLVKFI